MLAVILTTTMSNPKRHCRKVIPMILCRRLFHFIIPCFFCLITQGSLAQGQVLQLDEAVQLAISNNPQLEVARQQLAGDQATLQQAKSYYLPQLSAEAGFSRADIVGNNQI